MLKTRKGSPDFSGYGRLLRLTWPIIIQQLFSAGISSADVIMLNSVGQSAMAAGSLAAQYSNILYMVLYGLGTGVTMLSAQYWGKRDLASIQKVQGIAFRFSIPVSALFAAGAFLAPELMMRVFTTEAELIELGSIYLRAVAVSYLCWGISEVYLSALRSVERVVISTVLNVSALLLNIVLNAALVFGWFGLPRMSIAGAAPAPPIPRVVQLFACILVSFLSKDVHLRLSDMFQRSRLLMRDFISMALPAMGNDVVWGLGFSMYSVIMGHLGSDVVAANSVVTVVRNLGTVCSFAISGATGIILGKELGAGRFEEAEADASRALRLSVGAGCLGRAVIAALIPFVLSYASLNETAMGYLRIMMYINVYYIMGTAVNTTLIAGVFRAGGDSRFGFLCDTIDMWCYGVPLGFFAAFVLKLPPMWVYFLLCTDEFVKWPWVLSHYRKKKWVRNITRETAADRA